MVLVSAVLTIHGLHNRQKLQMIRENLSYKAKNGVFERAGYKYFENAIQQTTKQIHVKTFLANFEAKLINY